MKPLTLNWRDIYGNVSQTSGPVSSGLASGHYDNGGTSTEPSAWLVNLGYGAKTAAGVAIDECIAEGIPAVYACVHVISETVGQLPLKLYARTEKGRRVADDHPLYLLLHDLPNPEMTAIQFREVVTRHLAMWGRAYAFIQRDASGEVTALWPIHPTRVKVDRDGLNRKRFIVTGSDGIPVPYLFTPDRPPIMHLHINSHDGLDGRSPIWINRESLGITKGAEDYVGAWFGNGAIPGLIMTHPGRLSPKAKENIRESWWKRFGGARKANGVAIMEEGIDVKVVGVDPEKSQLEELRNLQIEQVASIWRVPTHMIQHTSKTTSWGSGIEQMMIGFINSTLMPYLEQWQQAITRDLLSRKTYRTHYAKFVTAALERGDLKATMDAFAVARQNTIYNADEIRAKLEENDIADGIGEHYLIPSGSQVLLGDGVPVGTEPASEPEPKPTMPPAKGVM
jgi:HK97 family phage portal protein